MIRAILIDGDQTLVARFETTGTNVVQSIARAMLRIVIGLQRYIIVNKLEGNPLHHRTGNLERATVYETEQSGDIITGTVGTSKLAPYGKVHEFGGRVNIREQIRTSKLGNSFRVRAHSANYPMRSYLRSSLRENETDIAAKLQKAANDGLVA